MPALTADANLSGRSGPLDDGLVDGAAVHDSRGGEWLPGAAGEREMSNEHIVRVGVLAAGAAHELAQPVATLSLLLSEIQQRVDGCDTRELVDQAVQQVQHCQKTLALLLDYGKQSFDGETEIERFDVFAGRCIEAFRARRPGCQPMLRIDAPDTAPAIRHDLALRQAVFNLLDNAADVSPDAVELRIGWDATNLRLQVIDRGPGIAAAHAGRLGELFFTTKRRGHGNGLGLYLANTAVIRLGGALRLRNLPSGGACAEIALPRADADVAARPGIAPAAGPSA